MVNFLPEGTVYGTLLNFRGERDSLGPRMDAAPYQAPPVAPILYIKTANTYSPHGTAIVVPRSVAEVEVGATIAMVMGDDGRVRGYLPMNDLTIPHPSFFRPPVRFKCVDGFLGIGATLLESSAAPDPSTFRLEVKINGATRQISDFSQLVRSAAELLADVGRFMTLAPGDVLMLGCAAARPLARAGDRIEIVAPGFATLENTLVGERA